MPVKRAILLAVAAVVLGLDQATKAWVVARVEVARDQMELVPGLLSVVHAVNTGAALGLLADSAYRLPVFYAFTAVAVALLLHMHRDLHPDDRAQSAALGLILGGALGNLADRLRFGAVTDFVQVHAGWAPFAEWLQVNLGSTDLPTFNLADAGIVGGVGLFLAHYALLERDSAERSALAGDGEAARR